MGCFKILKMKLFLGKFRKIEYNIILLTVSNILFKGKND